MGEFDALAAEIYKDKVRRARQTPPEEKLRDGLELWEMVLKFMKAGVLDRHPEADDAGQVELVRQQLGKLRRVREHQIYRPVSTGSAPASGGEQVREHQIYRPISTP